MLQEASQIYDQLGREATAAWARGEPHLDAHLLDQAADLRRGVSLAFWPTPVITERLQAFLGQLAAICPDQYFYRPEEFHVTALTIISGTPAWRPDIRHLPTYRALIRVVLQRLPAFKIRFRGVTASPGSVMIQGFPADETLARLRDDLRAAFAQAGFGHLLDRRYKIRTTHMTIARFCRPGTDWPRLTAWLAAHRQTDFGEMEVNCLRLVWGDWYATADRQRTLQEYYLKSPKNPI